MKKVITGDWDGQPIWREKTSREELLEAIETEEKRFKEELSVGDMKHISEYLEKHYEALNKLNN